MLLHGAQSSTQSMDGFAKTALRRSPRKRKAEGPDANNERLSKRLSLLNLEPTGTKLYVPVEDPATGSSSNRSRAVPSDDSMQLDNSKYKVYIYNLDDELSGSESEPEDGKLIFLPDIEKHLKMNRILPAIKANADGELAEHDSVRKAIIETRARAREKQRAESERMRVPIQIPNQGMTDDAPSSSQEEDPDAMDLD